METTNNNSANSVLNTENTTANENINVVVKKGKKNNSEKKEKTASEKLDLKNLFSAGKSAKNHNKFDYAKIAKNIRILSESLPKLKFMTEKDIIKIEKYPSQFIEAKTDKKLKTIEGKIKLAIRKTSQDINNVLESKSDSITNDDKKLAQLQKDKLTPLVMF